MTVRSRCALAVLAFAVTTVHAAAQGDCPDPMTLARAVACSDAVLVFRVTGEGHPTTHWGPSVDASVGVAPTQLDPVPFITYQAIVMSELKPHASAFRGAALTVAHAADDGTLRHVDGTLEFRFPGLAVDREYLGFLRYHDEATVFTLRSVDILEIVDGRLTPAYGRIFPVPPTFSTGLANQTVPQVAAAVQEYLATTQRTIANAVRHARSLPVVSLADADVVTVYRDVLGGQCPALRGGGALVVQRELVSPDRVLEEGQHGNVLDIAQSLGVSVAHVHDFVDPRNDEAILPADGGEALKATLIDRAEALRLGTRDFAQAFRERYPRGARLVVLSSIVFSESRSSALLFCSSSGTSYLVHVARKGNRWVLTKSIWLGSA